jgi:hypothetical protein
MVFMIVLLLPRIRLGLVALGGIWDDAQTQKEALTHA